MLQRAFHRQRYSELRRRIIRRVLRPWFHAGDVDATLTQGLDRTEIARVLVCRPNHRLGNLLLLTPLLAELRSLLPDARVDIVLAGDHGAELFQGFPNVSRIYSLSRRMVRHPLASGRVAMQIRHARYDLAIDPCEASQSSRLLAVLARPRHVLGVPRDRSAEARRPAWVNSAPVHMAKWPVYLLRGALRGPLPASGVDFPAVDVRLSVDERQHARELLGRSLRAPPRSSSDVILGVFVEATGAKRFSLDWWKRLLRALRQRRPDLAIIEIVPADGRPRLAPDVPGFGSPSPREVAAIIANVSCFVSADCGVMHLASAAGVPTLGLFSVSDAARYAPYGHGSQALPVNERRPEEVAQAVGLWIDACDPGDGLSAPGFAGGCQYGQFPGEPAAACEPRLHR